EAMTDRIEREAAAILDRIEAAGGTLAAIESGLIQRDIQESAYRAQRAVDAGESVVVGVNTFNEAGTTAPIETLRIDPGVERRQIGHRALAPAAGAAAGTHRVRHRPLQGTQPSLARRTGHSRGPGGRDLADLPGADDGSEPGLYRRRSDCRDAHCPWPREPARGARPGGGIDARGAHP